MKYIKKYVVTFLILLGLVALIITIKYPQFWKSFAGVDPNSADVIASRVQGKTLLLIDKLAKPTISDLIQRKEDMKSLMDKDVNKFFAYALSPEIRSATSKENQGFIEQKVTVKGILQELAIDDFKNNIGKEQYTLTQDNKKIDLYFLGNLPPNLRLGSQIEVTGYQIDNKIAVNSNDQTNPTNPTTQNLKILQLPTPTPKATPPPPTPTPNPPTPTSIPTSHPSATPTPSVIPTPTSNPVPIKINTSLAVVLINFADNRQTSITKDQIANAIFTDRYSLKSYYSEIGVNVIGSKSDVYGWLAIPDSSVNCSTDSWLNSTLSMARANNINLDKYDKVMLVFPYASSCWFGGLAQISGKFSWINGLDYARNVPLITQNDMAITIHELGHNLGAYHASSLSCQFQNKLVAISNNCLTNEYGDPFDVMGMIPRHMNNYHLFQLGLYDTDSQITVPENTSQTVTFDNNLFTSKHPLLKVFRRNMYYNTMKEFYYLEYRKPVNLFDNFSPQDPEVNGVTLRLAPDNDSYYSNSKLIDTTPSYDGNSWNDVTLKVGQTFDDNTYGTKITLQSLNNNNATVSINRYTPSCIHDAPLGSGYSIYGNPGQTIIFFPSFLNTDNTICNPAQIMFKVTSLPNPTIGPRIPKLNQTESSLPSPDIWSVLPQSSTSTVIPGEYAYAPNGISIHSPSTAKPGWYPITITATNLSGSNLSSTVTFYYVVQNVADVNH